MNTSSAPFRTAADLRAAGRAPACPFRIRLENGADLLLSRLLRVLPGKRVVCVGLWQGEPVLAKLFIAKESRRHWERERTGILALGAANLPTPALLEAGRMAPDGHYLLTRFLDDATPLDMSGETLREWLQPAMRLVGRLHAAGLVQTDLHLGNFLRQGDTLYLIDGDGVRSIRSGCGVAVTATRRNLALFLAQLPIYMEGRHDELVSTYRQSNPNATQVVARLDQETGRIRARRLRTYLGKCVRECSQFKVDKRFGVFTAVTRAEADSLAPLLADPDAWMARGTPLKAGNTSTVVRLDIEGRSLIVKRYNIKDLAHAVSRFWRPSRAWHSWLEGHRLAMLGISAPAPLALVEKRLGPLRGKAWLVMEYLEGPDLLHHWRADTPPTEDEFRALLRTFQGLAAARLSHGDLKATNLIWRAGEVALIDLDAMRWHRSRAGFERAWRRDMDRFLSNWPEDSALGSYLANQSVLSPGVLSSSHQR